MESPKKVVFESGSPSECLLSLNQQAAAVRTLALSWKILALLQMGSVTLGKSCYLFDRSKSSQKSGRSALLGEGSLC